MPLYLTESGRTYRMQGRQKRSPEAQAAIMAEMGIQKVTPEPKVYPDGYTYVFDRNVKVPHFLLSQEELAIRGAKPADAASEVSNQNIWALNFALDIKGFGVLEDELYATDDFGTTLYGEIPYFRDPAFDETQLVGMIDHAKKAFPGAFEEEASTAVVNIEQIVAVLDNLVTDPAYADVYQRLVQKRSETQY